MPRYLTQHTLACLTRQGAEALAQRMQAGGLAHAERVLENMLEGKMFVEFRADSRENLEAWLKTEGMRSEEHTSELQSRLHLVCRLLLETQNHKSEMQSRFHTETRLKLATATKGT